MNLPNYIYLYLDTIFPQSLGLYFPSSFPRKPRKTLSILALFNVFYSLLCFEIINPALSFYFPGYFPLLPSFLLWCQTRHAMKRQDKIRFYTCASFFNEIITSRNICFCFKDQSRFERPGRHRLMLEEEKSQGLGFSGFCTSLSLLVLEGEITISFDSKLNEGWKNKKVLSHLK